ncbi:MAG: matrixin family metalloprotease [Bradymonadia bacterium]
MSVRSPAWRGLMSGAVITLSASFDASAYTQTTTHEDGTPIEWPQRCLTWRLNELGSDDVDMTTLQETLILATEAWNQVSCSDLAFLYDGLTARSETGFNASGANANVAVFREEPGSWIHSTSAIALATTTYCLDPEGTSSACPFHGALVDVDIEFNGVNYTFFTGDQSSSGAMDLQSTAAHEFGHFLGLAHSTEPEATMHDTQEPGETHKRDLHQDDIDGICAIYPASTAGGDACANQAPAGDFTDIEAPVNQGLCGQSGGTGSVVGVLALMGLMRRRRAPR